MPDKDEVLRLKTAPFIMEYPNLFKARAKKSRAGKDTGKATFGLTAIWLDPDAFEGADKAAWVKVLKALSEVSLREFKKKWSELKEPAYKPGIRKNDVRENPFDFEGVTPRTMFANITSSFQPGVVDLHGNEISLEKGNTDLVYRGCLARCTVNFYSFRDESKGVALGLNNVQIISSDTAKYPRLDSRKDAADEFDDEVDSRWLGEEDEPEVNDDDGDGDGGY